MIYVIGWVVCFALSQYLWYREFGYLTPMWIFMSLLAAPITLFCSLTQKQGEKAIEWFFDSKLFKRKG